MLLILLDISIDFSDISEYFLAKAIKWTKGNLYHPLLRHAIWHSLIICKLPCLQWHQIDAVLAKLHSPRFNQKQKSNSMYVWFKKDVLLRLKPDVIFCSFKRMRLVLILFRFDFHKLLNVKGIDFSLNLDYGDLFKIYYFFSICFITFKLNKKKTFTTISDKSAIQVFLI